MATSKGFSRLMDTSTEENMRTIARSHANGSMTDKISKKHSQIDKIYSEDPKVNDSFGR